MSRLTAEDRRLLQYFYEEKGDIERFSRFEDIRSIIAEEYPELLFALTQIKVYEKAVKQILEDMQEEDE